MPASSTLPSLLCYEELVAAESDGFDWPDFDENTAGDALLHVRHHGQSEGRAVQPPLHGAARDGLLHARRQGLLGAKRDTADRADVPRQRLGHPVFGTDGRREARVSRRGARRQEPVRALREREGRDVRRRAHGLARPDQLHEAEQPPVLDVQEHDDRRLGVPAGDDEDAARRLRRARPARLGNDRDEPGRHDRHSEGQAPRPDAGPADGDRAEAGPAAVRRRDEDRRRRGQRAAARRRRRRQRDGQGAVGRARLLPERSAEPARRRLVPDRRRRHDRRRRLPARSPTARRTSSSRAASGSARSSSRTSPSAIRR